MIKKISIIFTVVFVFLCSCVYYNTFYNAKQKFKKAEQNQLNSNENQRRRDDSEANRASAPQEPTISSNDKILYNSAIDKANKVVIYHPDSKYIDDALWIIGKSRYNMTEYITSDKKLKELAVRFPNSKYVDDAYFYMGMNQFWLNNNELALEAFNSVADMKKSPLKDDAVFMISYMDFIRGNYSTAISLFDGLLKTYPKSDSAAAAQFFVGACYDSLGEYIQAMNAYEKVEKYNPSHDLYYYARFAYGSSAYKADSVNLGMSIFNDLARKERYFEKSSMIKLKHAEGLYLIEQIDEAENEYLKIIEQFPKTNQSAEAYYRLGLIYQNTKDDLSQAKKYYNNATKEKRSSNYYNLALAKSAQISKLETYWQKLGRNQSKESETGDSLAVNENQDKNVTDSLDTVLTKDNPDSLVSSSGEPMGDQPKPSYLEMLERMELKDKVIPIDSIKGQNEPDLAEQNSTQKKNQYFTPEEQAAIFEGIIKDLGMDSLKNDTTIAQDSVSSVSIEEDVEIRFLLAELYHHDLNRPDSALNEYLLLAKTYPESEYTPRALLASAFIYEEKEDRENARKQYLEIINFYPSSEQAKYAVTKIKGAQVPPGKDIELLYMQAENMYFVYNNPDSAITLFSFIEENFPGSEYAVKSAFFIAWLISLTLDNDGDSTAYHAFASIVENYPETPYAEDAKIRMGLTKRTAPETNRKQQQEREEKLSPHEDSLSRAQADSLRRLANTLPRAPAVKDTGEFIYPESLLREIRSRRIRGVVTFKIKLDLFGNVGDYELLGPSGNTEIDSLATEALINTTFDMTSMTDLSMLDEYFRYDIRFEPPEYDDFYDDIYNDPDSPYRERREQGP